MEESEESGLNLNTLVTGSLYPLSHCDGMVWEDSSNPLCGPRLGDASVDGDLPQWWQELGSYSVLCPSSWQM